MKAMSAAMKRVLAMRPASTALMTLTGAPGTPGWTMLTGCADAGVVTNRQAAMAVPAVSIGARLVIKSPLSEVGARLASSPRMGRDKSDGVHPANGSRTRIVSSRWGEVLTSATGQRINSSMRRTYLIACAGKSAHDRAPAVVPLQPSNSS